jgi:uncharacterized protein YvpB
MQASDSCASRTAQSPEAGSPQDSLFNKTAPTQSLEHASPSHPGNSWVALLFLDIIDSLFSIPRDSIYEMQSSMRIFLRLVQETRNLLYEILVHLKSIPQTITNDVPYICQFATPESAELSLSEKLQATNDPDWKNTGASSPERYAEWAFTMCGMASTLMALQFFQKDPTLKVAELAEDALENGVYTQEPTEISNMKYREYAQWVQKYGIRARVYTRLSIRGIQYALSKGKLVIISVNPNIRGYNTAPTKQKGGHLVLVTGYDRKQGIISINNPSGFVSSNTQINHSLLVKDFLSYYAERGIIVSTP